MKFALWLVLGIVIGFLVGRQYGFSTGYGIAKDDGQRFAGPKQKYVVAGKALPEGSTLALEDIAVAFRFERNLPADSIKAKDYEAAVGKRTAVSLDNGDLLLKRYLK